MFVKITSGNVDQYPYTIGQLRRDNPTVSFPRNISDEVLADFDVYPVTQGLEPDRDIATQNVSQNDTPTLVDDVWTLEWTVSAKTADEIADYNERKAGDNRAIRNNLLAETDWTANSDVTMSSEMATYRQALRNITSHANWPHLEDADWPTKPV